MTRKAIAAFTVMASLALTLQSLAAEQGHGDGKEHHATATKEQAVTPQTTCPVMGGKINPDLYVDVDGKRIYVCCQGCIPTIKKDPGKYIKKLEEQGVTVARLQTTCPVMGGKINPKLYVDSGGKRLYVCCADCLAKVKADPEKYIKKAEDSGATLAKAPGPSSGVSQAGHSGARKQEHEGHQH